MAAAIVGEYHVVSVLHVGDLQLAEFTEIAAEEIGVGVKPWPEVYEGKLFLFHTYLPKRYLRRNGLTLRMFDVMMVKAMISKAMITLSVVSSTKL